MDYYELYDYMLKHDGFTVNSSLDIPNGLKFIVSLENSELIVEKKELTLGLFIKTIIDYKLKLKRSEGQYIGCWYNEGYYYFDISESYDIKEIALIIALQNNQLAIYDAINDQTIEIKR